MGSEHVRQWHWIGAVASAHVLMLHEAGMADERTSAILLRAIANCRVREVPIAGPLIGLIGAFDGCVDESVPSGYTAVASTGRGTIDVAATVGRLTLREAILEFAQGTHAFRAQLAEMAGNHVVTLMPAHIDGQAAQPTTFGHWLGGALGPLGRASASLRATYAVVNASPLGAGSLASSGMAVDREGAAAVLGFDGLVTNTFDAVSAVDHFVAVAESAAAVVGPVVRLLDALLGWIRAEPESFLLSAEWTTVIDGLPHARFPLPLANLIAKGRAVEALANELATTAARQPYGPVAGGLDRLGELASLVLRTGSEVLQGATALLTNGIVVNRALLANRAGKGLITSGDLADFLMIEEQLEPAAARDIAALTLSRARDGGIGAAGITVDLIDGAALLAIGRELKVEFEAISRYLAPRRFVERRSAAGAPAPAATRAYLDAEATTLAGDTNWVTVEVERLGQADAELAGRGTALLTKFPAESAGR